MPWKFLVFLVFLAIVILFAGINVANSTDINLGFYQFEDVPIFVGLGSAYMLGALSILPFALTKAFSKRRKLSSKYKERNEAEKEKSRRKASRKGGDAPDASMLADSTGSGAGSSAGQIANETRSTVEKASDTPGRAKARKKSKGLFRKGNA
ncbi:MAG: hypothetical protein ACLFM0_08395 [Spirochaetales bacterium]